MNALNNPSKLPKGICVKIPTKDLIYEPFKCGKFPKIVITNSEICDVEQWLEEAKWFNQDLEFLLKLENNKFWNQLILDKSCTEATTSFLQEGIPYYIPITSLTKNEEIINIYTNILNNVLRIFARMVCNKDIDTNTEWISKEGLGDLLYSKFLISVPMLFDLLIIFGRSNLDIINKIMQKILKIEPKYNKDVEIGLRFLQKTLLAIEKKIEEDNVGDRLNHILSYDDLAIYILDCSSTLSMFLEIFPETANICADIRMELSISKFYDNSLSLLYKNLCQLNLESKSLIYLNLSRVELLKSFRIITYLQIENIFKDPKNRIISAESFIGTLTECLADKVFVIDYQIMFPVENDVEFLKQSCETLDMFKVDFVLKGYTIEGEQCLHEFNENCGEDDLNEPITPSESLNDLGKEVEKVLDVLPHLGDVFIRKLLTRFKSAHLAIAAYFEGNLPPDLINIDQSEINPSYIKELAFTIQPNNKQTCTSDVVLHDFRTEIAKYGKGRPGAPKNLKQMLDDKRHIKQLKERYQQYSLISDYEYDDEYDDTYDEMADNEAKTAKRNAFKDVIPDEIDDNEEADGNNEADGEETIRDTSKDFCENPETIRERYNQKRNTNLSCRQLKKIDGDTNKSQGQSNETLESRRKKEVNKATRSNHNRKSGASWKRNKGMIPS